MYIISEVTEMQNNIQFKIQTPIYLLRKGTDRSKQGKNRVFFRCHVQILQQIFEKTTEQQTYLC